MRLSSYVLPFRANAPPPAEFIDYVNRLSCLAEVILVDASPGVVYQAVEAQTRRTVIHIRPDADLMRLRNGKVRGVLTGLRVASHELVILADDDVRYSEANLGDVLALLQEADVVRPQNYFEPLPWHARLDTARSLVNRMTGGDWPGTLAIRRSTLNRLNGYDGDVLFENLELIRTVEAGGGVVLSPLDLLVRRLPPGTRHYWSQRVRQAYDEFARPTRLCVALAGLPLLSGLIAFHHWAYLISVFVIAPVLVAELGRRRDGGRRVFPPSTSLAAPLWILERAACAWLALGIRAVIGGMPYHGNILPVAANSSATLVARQRNRTAIRRTIEPIVRSPR